MKKKATVVENIYKALDEIEFGQSIDKSTLYKELYGHEDYFKRRSFDVALCNAKKKFTDKEFNSSSGGLILRIK